MSWTTQLAAINVYPIKSLDGVSVASARVLPSGALEFDRRWQIVDASGRTVNAKRTERIHRLRSTFDLDQRRVTLAAPDHSAATLMLDEPRAELEHWLSDFFGFAVYVQEQPHGGFPDDTDSPGPTVVSQTTLATVATWFPGLNVDSIRRRFRANLELAGDEPFAEDRLVGAPGTVVLFRVGEALFEGTNPCQRCPVPTRDPDTGDVWPALAKQFAEQRAATLPSFAPRARFDHFYRLSVNTQLALGQRGGVIRVGDKVCSV